MGYNFREYFFPDASVARAYLSKYIVDLPLNSLFLMSTRWNAGSFSLGGGVGDPGCYDTTSPSTRGKKFLAAICNWKVLAPKQLSGPFCMG